MQKGLSFEAQLGTETVCSRQSSLMLHIDVAAGMVGEDGSAVMHVDRIRPPSGTAKTSRHGTVMVVNGDALAGEQVILFELLLFVGSCNIPGGVGGPFLCLSKLTCRTINGIAVGHSLGIPAWDSALFN